MLMNGQASNKQLTENIMSTYTNNLIAGNGTMLGIGWVPVVTRTGGAAATTAKGKARLVKRARNVALFFAAPFVGLVYLLAFPFVGFAMLAWMAGKAAMKSDKARPIALALAAPFIALAFVTVGPIVGLGAIACTAGRALLKA